MQTSDLVGGLIRSYMSVNASKATDEFSLKTPCGMCPFRSDKPFPLRPARAEEIADTLHDGGSFHCHKTVDYDSDEYDLDDDESSEGQIVESSKHCAGALITLEKEEAPNQLMRIAERLGLYDHTTMNMDAPVFDSLEEWVDGIRSHPLNR